MQKVYQQFRSLFTGRFRMASVLSISLLAMLLLQVAGASARSISQNPVYYACANYNTGKIYVIQQNGKCNAGYTLIQWNQTGPQGPQGPLGPQGPQGPQGPAGASQGYYSTGGVGSSISNPTYAPVVVTNPVSAGTYIVTATELAVVDTGDIVGCYIQSVNGSLGGFNNGEFGPASEPQLSTITVIGSITVSAGDQFELLCTDYYKDPNTFSYNAEISAIQLNAVGSNVPPKGQGHKPTLAPPPHH